MPEELQGDACWKSPGPDGLLIEFWDKIWPVVVSIFVLICNFGTCVHATAMETRTSEADPQEGQAMNHW